MAAGESRKARISGTFWMLHKANAFLLVYPALLLG
jgi:hypothetical protein